MSAGVAFRHRVAAVVAAIAFHGALFVWLGAATNAPPSLGKSSVALSLTIATAALPAAGTAEGSENSDAQIRAAALPVPLGAQTPRQSDTIQPPAREPEPGQRVVVRQPATETAPAPEEPQKKSDRMTVDPAPRKLEPPAPVAKPPPPPRAKPVETKRPAKPKKKKQVAAKRASRPGAARSGRASRASPSTRTAALGNAATRSARAAARARKAYLARVLARLRRAKRYPNAARLAKRTGIATLTFTIAKSGRVTSSRVSRSTGHAILDRATLAMLRRASPMPPIPPTLGKASISVSVPVRFRLQ